jgi:hypothetical protein
VPVFVLVFLRLGPTFIIYEFFGVRTLNKHYLFIMMYINFFVRNCLSLIQRFGRDSPEGARHRLLLRRLFPSPGKTEKNFILHLILSESRNCPVCGGMYRTCGA